MLRGKELCRIKNDVTRTHNIKNTKKISEIFNPPPLASKYVEKQKPIFAEKLKASNRG